MRCTAPARLEGGMVDALRGRQTRSERGSNTNIDVLEDVLSEETHGVMVYQEQVMRILNRLGGIRTGVTPINVLRLLVRKKKETDRTRITSSFMKGAESTTDLPRVFRSKSAVGS